MDQGSRAGKDSSSWSKRTMKLWFGVFSTLKLNIFETSQGFFLLYLICALQLLALPISVLSDEQWVGFLPSVTLQISTGLTPGLWQFTSESSFLILLGFSLSLILLSSVGLLIIAFDEYYRLKQRSITPFIGVLLRMNGTVLHVPILLTLSRAITGNITTGTKSYFLEGSTSYFVIAVSSGVAIVVLVVSTSFHALTVYHHLPYGKAGMDHNLWSMAHGRVESLALIVRSIVAIIFGLELKSTGSTLQSANILLDLFVLVSGAFLTVLTAATLPYYDQRKNKFLVLVYVTFFWSGLTTFVAQRLGTDGELTGPVLFFGTLPFCYITALSICNWRIIQIRDCEQTQQLGPYLVELHLRLKYQDLRQNVTFHFSGKAEVEYRKVLEQFPRSPFLNLYLASLVTSCSNRIIFSLNLIRQAKQSHMPIDLEFHLFHHHRIHERIQSEQEGNQLSFLDIDQQVASTRELLQTTLLESATFWKILWQGNFSLSQLMAHGAKVHELMDTCTVQLQKLRKIAHSNKEAIQLQAAYSLYLLNDKRGARRLFAKMESQIESDGASNAVCLISGDRNNLGEILKTSDGLLRLFGYNKSDLIGRNVNILCPPPFDRMHDSFLRQFVSTDSDFTTAKRRVFGLHAKGHIIQLDLEITPHVNAESELVLGAKFREIHTRQDQDCHMLMVELRTGTVTATSENTTESLNIDEQEIYAMSLKIFDLFDCHFDDAGQLTFAEDRHRVTSLTNDATYSIHTKEFKYANRTDSEERFEIGVVLVFVSLASVHAIKGGEISKSESRSHADETSKDELAIEKVDLHGLSSARLNESGKFHFQQNRSNRISTLQTIDQSRGVSSMSKGRRKRNSQNGDDASLASTTLGGDDENTLRISKIHARIRKNLSTRDPKLYHFGKYAVRFLLLYVVLAILFTYLAASNLYKIFEESEMLRHMYHHCHHIQTVASTLLFGAHSRFVQVGSVEYPRRLNTSAALKLIQSSVDGLKDEHLRLSSYAETSSQSDAIRSIFFGPVVPEYYKLGGSELTSFNLLVQEVINHGVTIVENESIENGCTESCQFILNNAMDGLRDNAKLLKNYFQLRTTDSVESLNFYNWVTAGVFVLVLIIAFFGIYFPIFANNNKRKEKVGRAFGAIPEQVCLSLKQRAEKRISNLSGESRDMIREEDEFDDENHFDIDEAINSGSLVSFTASPNAYFPESPIKSPGGSTGGRKVAPMTSRSVSKWGNKHAKQRNRKESTVSWLIQFSKQFLQAAITFWTALAFLVFTILLDQHHDTVMHQMTANLAVAGMRFNFALDSLFFASLPVVIEPWEIRTLTKTADQLMNATHDMELADSALKYGNTSLYVEPFQLTSGTMYELYFENACSQSCLDYIAYNTFANETQNVESLRHGLVLALDFLKRSLDVAAHSFDNYSKNVTAENLLTLQAAQRNIKELSPSMLIIDQLGESLELYSSALSSEVSTISGEKAAACVLTVLALLIAHVFSLGAFNRMDKDLKKTQILLLMLPLEIYRQVPEMQMLLGDEPHF